MEQTEEKKVVDVDINKLSGGLEILVQLAEKGDIDPWDIDIIDVTDKYLRALNKSPRENLLNAGRGIFFASVLLRLKSDILLNISNETLLASQQTENYFPEDDLLNGNEEIRLDLSKLESFLIRSSLSKQQRKKRISLGDLIFALQQAEEEEERRATRSKLRAERAFTIVAPETPDDFFEIAQEEDIDDVVERIEAIIEEHLTSEKPITLSFLSEILNNKTKPFLALLFLTHSQKVVLEQKEFYGEVFIHRAGTILPEPKEPEGRGLLQQAPTKKKGLFNKIKEKIIHARKPKKVEQQVEPNEVFVEIKNNRNEESEVINNGNNSRESRESDQS